VFCGASNSRIALSIAAGLKMHVLLRRDEILMARELLDRAPGAPRIARCEQNEWGNR
jgi:hypothetical protein